MTHAANTLVAILTGGDLALSGNDTPLDKAKSLFLSMSAVIMEVCAFDKSGDTHDLQPALDAVANFRRQVTVLEAALRAVKPKQPNQRPVETTRTMGVLAKKSLEDYLAHNVFGGKPRKK